jgi:hypothetical protein
LFRILSLTSFKCPPTKFSAVRKFEIRIFVLISNFKSQISNLSRASVAESSLDEI